MENYRNHEGKKYRIVTITECPLCGAEVQNNGDESDPLVAMASCTNNNCELYGELFNNSFRQYESNKTTDN